MSGSLRPHGLWPARLLCPWDSQGKNTGVGCHALLQGISQARDRISISYVSCIGSVWSGSFSRPLPSVSVSFFLSFYIYIHTHIQSSINFFAPGRFLCTDFFFFNQRTIRKQKVERRCDKVVGTEQIVLHTRQTKQGKP